MKVWLSGSALLSGLLVVAGCSQPTSPSSRNQAAPYSSRTANERSGSPTNPTGTMPTPVTPRAGEPGGPDRKSGYSGNPNAAAGQEGQAALSPREFATQAYQGGLAEIQLGKLAESRAQNPEVKRFAQRMVKDHTQANEQLQSLASKEHLTLPEGTHAGQENQQMVDRLSKLKGEEFDRMYMQHMLEDHQKDIQMFQAEAQDGKNASLRQWASKTLPILQTHLRLAQQAATAVNAPGAGQTSH